MNYMYMCSTKSRSDQFILEYKLVLCWELVHMLICLKEGLIFRTGRNGRGGGSYSGQGRIQEWLNKILWALALNLTLLIGWIVTRVPQVIRWLPGKLQALSLGCVDPPIIPSALAYPIIIGDVVGFFSFHSHHVLALVPDRGSHNLGSKVFGPVPLYYVYTCAACNEITTPLYPSEIPPHSEAKGTWLVQRTREVVWSEEEAQEAALPAITARRARLCSVPHTV